MLNLPGNHHSSRHPGSPRSRRIMVSMMRLSGALLLFGWAIGNPEFLPAQSPPAPPNPVGAESPAQPIQPPPASAPKTPPQAPVVDTTASEIPQKLPVVDTTASKIPQKLPVVDTTALKMPQKTPAADTTASKIPQKTPAAEPPPPEPQANDKTSESSASQSPVPRAPESKQAAAQQGETRLSEPQVASPQSPTPTKPAPNPPKSDTQPVKVRPPSASPPKRKPPQSSTASRLAQLRHIVALRDAQSQSPPAQVIVEALTHLKEFPQGKYRDEALLILANAQVATQQPSEALATLDRLIVEHPESPFREQAMVDSLPLLAESGEAGVAESRVDALVKAYPNSVQRNPAMMWLAGNRFGAGDHAGTLRVLDLVDRGGALTGQQQTDFYRMQTVSLVQTGQSAWTPLNRYLQRKDSAVNKAGVLALVGKVALDADRPEEALRYYRQIVEDFPVAEHLDDALYWRAALFRRTRLANAPAEVATARRETAIGYYNAYLKTEGGAHKADAYLGRGELHRSAGDHEAALADIDGAVAQNPDLGRAPKVIRARVALYKAMDRPEEALALLAVAKGDEDIPREERTAFLIDEAILQYEAKDCAQVESLLNPMPIISDRAVRPRAFFMRGFCRYQQGLWEKATFDLEGLINDPQYQTLALSPLLDAYEKSGQSSRLVHLAEELLQAGRIDPEPEVFIRLARGYETLGEPALMISAYQRLEETDPEAVKVPKFQAALGRANEKLGHGKEAVNHYRSALALMDEAATTGDDAPRPPTKILYLETLERLQVLLLTEQNFGDLSALYANAEATLGEEGPENAERRRLETLKAGLSVAWGRAALKRGEPNVAIEQLTAALARMPAGVSEGRMAAAALLVAAHLAADAPGRALAVFNEEAAQPATPAPPKDSATPTPPTLPKHPVTEETVQRDPIPPEALLALAVIKVIPAKLERGRKPDDRDKAAPTKPTTADPTAAKRTQRIAFYKRLLEALPSEAIGERRATALVLDRLYKAEGDFPARAALVQSLRKDGFDEAAREELRVYLSGIYREWGGSLMEKKDHQGARFQLERGLILLKKEEWTERYALVSLLGQEHLKQGATTEFVIITENILPDIQDTSLAGKVRHYLGQIHLDWAKSAEKEGNVKSARIRFHRALDYLPIEDWQRRLTAANGLVAIWIGRNQTVKAVSLLAEEMPNVPDPSVAQQYALYLAKLYLNTLKQPQKASPWLARADRGDKGSLSVEAGYLLAEVELKTNPAAGLKRLGALAERRLQGSLWEVPVNYRLALLHHERKAMKAALRHYKAVAAAQNPEARRTYPRAIRQSAKMAAEIERFLKSSSSGTISVPRVSGE